MIFEDTTVFLQIFTLLYGLFLLFLVIFTLWSLFVVNLLQPISIFKGSVWFLGFWLLRFSVVHVFDGKVVEKCVPITIDFCHRIEFFRKMRSTKWQMQIFLRGVAKITFLLECTPVFVGWSDSDNFYQDFSNRTPKNNIMIFAWGQFLERISCFWGLPAFSEIHASASWIFEGCRHFCQRFLRSYGFSHITCASYFYNT